MKEQPDDNNLALIVKFLSNELDSDEVLEFDRWIRESENHQQELEKAKKIWDMAASESQNDEYTDKAWKRLHQRIHEVDGTGFSRRRQYISFSWKIAASVLVLLGLGFMLYFMVHVQSDTREITTLTDKILKPVILPDGTRVYLNSGTKIRYSSEFKNHRKVQLSGEAFFNVTHDTNHPFTVQTSNAQIIVVGTSFNVSASTDSVEVVVESGIVKLSSRNINNEISLTKGNSGKYIANINQLIKTSEADINSLAWKTNVITFNNVDLNYVSKTLVRLYHKPIYFENDKLKFLKLNATYKDLDLEGIFRALRTTHCLDIKEKDGAYHISGTGCY